MIRNECTKGFTAWAPCPSLPAMIIGLSFGLLTLALSCFNPAIDPHTLVAAEPTVGEPGDSIAESVLREKIKPALKLIEHSSAVYLRERECFSCHHQAMSIMTLMLARERALAVDHQNLVNQVQRSIEHLERGAETYRQGKGQGGGVDTAGYALMGLAAAGYPANVTTDAVVEYLLQIHAESRRWKCSSNRPPTEASDITTSALALHGLNHFAPGYAKSQAALNSDSKDSAEKPPVAQRVVTRRTDCEKWLSTRKVDDTEDRVFRLFAAQELEQPDIVKSMQQELVRSQREDGGWAQAADMTSDAYATGTALVALAKSGWPTHEVNYQRGLRFLIEQQLPDGSWHVVTRSKPIQKYFESGFPHGVDQFISISATCWSSMAMLLALPKTDASADKLVDLPWHKRELEAPSVVSGETGTKPKQFSAEQIEFFERNIRPLLVENCVSCHGSEKQSGNLRVDALASMLSGGDTGPALVPGKPERSLMIKAVKRGDELKMPPEDPLSQSKIELLEQWITMGAPWPESSKSTSIDSRREAARKHWAFQRVRAVEVPEARQPSSMGTPANNAIDRFVHSALAAQQLEPNVAADRRTLLTRLFYDLSGLPPTAEAIEQFVDDDRPDAYERQVDRLLASPRFGEHWGRKWLDIARYSDSKGYVYAREERFYVNAPAYRDWVIDALASDMPYDRFLMLQLAADQVAPDDVAAQAAMGYLTLGRRFLGVTHDIIDDRIDVVTRGLLGLTVGCARCHDHKFDPIPTDDYYSLYGVFLNVTEERVEVRGSTRSGVLASTSSNSEEMKKFYEELAKRQTKLRETLAAERATASKRVMERLADYLMAQLEMEKVPAEGFDIIIGRDDLVPAQVRRVHDYLLDAQSRNDRVFKAWHALAKLPSDQFASHAAATVADLQKLSASELNPHVARMFLVTPSSLREVADRYAKLLNDLDNIEGTSEDEVEALRELRELLAAASSPFIVPDEQIVSTEQFFESRVCEALWKLQGEVDRWILQSPIAPPFATVLVDRTAIREPYVFRRGNPLLITHRVPRHFLSAVTASRPEPTQLTASNLTASNSSTREPDSARVPEPFVHGSGRLELARAIVDHDNPLTARVWVNRLWQHLFGQGFVTTPSDFGLRATPPSHPELLDFLSHRLWESSGSTKQLLREMVLSSTYQQSSVPMRGSAVTSRAKELDPDNRLLWHAPMKRLTFEQQRDTWLMVAGALDNTRGGRARSMFDNDDNARRTVYGQVDRQFLPGVLRVFDFANPDLHTPVRSETIVPQQALFELNHPFASRTARRVVESSTRMLEDESNRQTSTQAAERDRARDRMRIVRMFEQVLARSPSTQEMESALAFLDQPPSILPQRRIEADAWQYGYAKLDESTGMIEGFKKLPHFSGTAWQGGSKWPDTKLGWVQLTSTGGHAGNDLDHAAVRRWTAPMAGEYRVQSQIKHNTAQGDGVRATLVVTQPTDGGRPQTGKVASRVLKQQVVHNSAADMAIDSIQLEAGDTLDFVVDFHKNLNNDQFEWVPKIECLAPRDQNQTSDTALAKLWSAEADFAGARVEVLTVWEQLAQVLLVSNELMFIE